ncbi:MAG: DUF3054 family protein [Anaerolineales bacterium]|nr:DUF3054 family protein [Anaerolineales bacterium]MDW8277285.1 DUF3054 family protein [Anaerolineales bacterium]
MPPLRWLILGDMLVMALLVMIGFTTHGETGLAFLPRMAAAFVPLTLAWFGLAPWLGLFRPPIVADVRQGWRAALTMVFAGPLAALLRAILLGTVVIPTFAVVFSGTAAVGMTIWRLIWAYATSKAQRGERTNIPPEK